MQITGRGIWIALTSAILWAASIAAMLGGGYVVAVGTPCLCADVNGLMLGGGLVIILVSAAMLLWSRDLARLVVDRVTSLTAQTEIVTSGSIRASRNTAELLKVRRCPTNLSRNNYDLKLAQLWDPADP